MADDDAEERRGLDGDATRRPRWGRMLLTSLVALAVFLVVGNALIMASMGWFRATAPDDATPDWVRITNFRQVDERVYRGAAPSGDGLADLRRLGVTTVVDVRAETDHTAAERAAAAGMAWFHLPIRDGQLPDEGQVEEFLRIVEDASAPVFLHCGAGVGRTGAMSAVYLNATGQTDGTEALRQNLAVGPPSLEQIVFSVRTADGEYRRPGPGVTALSRVLDGPRRIWHNLT